MNDSNVLPAALSGIAQQLPVIVVCMAGCVAVLVRRSSLPRSAVAALAGFALGLLVSVVSPVVWVTIQRALQGHPAAEIGRVFTVVGVAFSLAWALALALLLVATLSGRTTTPPPMPG